jgi:hypothetical protein
MTIASWPEWLPDQADFGSAGSPVIKGVIPLTPKSYGPMPSAVPWSTNTLDAVCQGAYSVKAPDGQVRLIAGDRTKLYQVPPGGGTTIVDASRTTGGAYNTPGISLSGGHWAMTSFGDRLVATNGVDPIQTMLLGEANFTALQPGAVGPPVVAAAPLAKYVAVVKDFLFVGNTNDPIDGPVPYRVWWSAIANVQSWPQPGSIEAQQVMSDYQDLQQTDLGNITQLVSGFAPGSDCVIFTERGCYSASFTGPPLLFNFRVISGVSGTMAPRSVVQAFARDNSGALRPVVYALGSDGFFAFDGSTSFPIGAQKFDRLFWRELDGSYLSYVQGISDPRSRAIIWGFATPGSGGLISRLLVYNWELARASYIELEPAAYLEWLTVAMFGTSYNLDTIPPEMGNLDTLSPSFDDPFWTGNQESRLSLFDRDHRLNIGGGPALPVTMETAEMQPNEGRRAWVRLTRPLNDGGISTIAVGHRERLTDPVIWEAPVNINQLGECPQRATGRYLRFRMTLPAGQAWTHAQGIDMQIIPEGQRR